MKIKGKVERSDLEGGYLTLVAGGETYKLEGGGSEKLKSGASVEVEGSVDKTVMGIGFGTPTLRVKSYKIL